MSETHQVSQDGYEQETREVMAWFSRYDGLVAAGELEAMADMAVFPINEVTDDADGFGVVGPCDRDRFLAQMREVFGGAGEVEMESKRRPVFLSRALCFVITDATITAGGQTNTMRYGDLLIRTPEGWRFQTMVAGGWGDQM
ncbi:MAG: nuclear transport factor 2 family protein [Mycobacteriales bacterium]